MRTIIAAVICLVLVFVAGIFSYAFIDNSSQSINGELDQLEEKIRQEDWIVANRQLKIMKDKWEKTKSAWVMFIDHQKIDNIDITLSRMSEYIGEKNLTEALAEISSLKLLFKLISVNEAFSLNNIL